MDSIVQNQIIYWGVHSSLDDHKTWNSPITAHDWKGQANFIAALIEEGKIKNIIMKIAFFITNGIYW